MSISFSGLTDCQFSKPITDWPLSDTEEALAASLRKKSLLWVIFSAKPVPGNCIFLAEGHLQVHLGRELCIALHILHVKQLMWLKTHLLLPLSNLTGTRLIYATMLCLKHKKHKYKDFSISVKNSVIVSDLTFLYFHITYFSVLWSLLYISHTSLINCFLIYY